MVTANYVELFFFLKPNREDVSVLCLLMNLITIVSITFSNNCENIERKEIGQKSLNVLVVETLSIGKTYAFLKVSRKVSK